MPNVLVFESDGSFAGELKGELERRGCNVTVVDDASVGLQTAASDRPDLILLTIELPRMNGFSVCNKLKRDPTLKEVPLIIMSSDSTEETFEQHRRLRTHAEDYVHKPISFIELLPRITAHVSLANGGGAEADAPPTDDDVVIDADVEFEEDLSVSAESVPEAQAADPAEDAPHAAATGVDDEVDAFTENAFGSMMDEQAPAEDPVAAVLQSVPSNPLGLPFNDAEASPMSLNGIDLDATSLPPAAALPDLGSVAAVALPDLPGLGGGASADEPRPPARAVSSMPPRPRIEPVDTALRDELTRQAERSRDLERELREAQGRIEELEDETARAATKDSEVQRLQRELDETKAKAAAGPVKGAGSAREFLDLREALNRKDKELLDLKDQVTHREKELLALRDGSLSIEREKADLQDRIEAFEKQISDGARLLDGAKADKEQASKRADDFKRKSEKLQGELDSKSTELEDTRRRLTEDTAARDERETALRAELDEARSSAAHDKESAVVQAREEATRSVREALERAHTAAMDEVVERTTKDREQAILTRELDLRREQDAKLAALHRASEESLNRIRAEHSQVLSDEKAAAARGLADQESRYAREHEAVIKEYEKSHQNTKDELAQVNATLEGVRREKDEGHSSRDARIGSLESDLSARQTELDAQKRTLDERQAELDSARADLAATRQELSDVQAALAGERQKTERANTKWTDDRASLERAKDALAAALAQLDDIGDRSLD